MPASDAPPLQPAARGRRTVLIVWLCVAAGAFLLHSFPPGASHFYPRCVWHQLTGFSCPGCGSTRALHHLLHGRFLVAIQSNVLLILALPWLVMGSARWSFNEFRGMQQPTIGIGWRACSLFFALLLAFGIFRNLPFELCRWFLPLSE